MLSDVLNSHINNFNIVAFTRNNYIGYIADKLFIVSLCVLETSVEFTYI